MRPIKGYIICHMLAEDNIVKNQLEYLKMVKMPCPQGDTYNWTSN